MNISFSKAICLHVTTYESLIDKGDSLIPFLNSLLSTFLPYLKNDLLIELQKINKRTQSMKYTEKNINKVFTMLKNKELNVLQLVDYYKHTDDPYYDENALPALYPPNFSLSISCNYASTFPANFQNYLIFPNEITFSLSDRVLGEYIPQFIQQQFINFFEQALSISGAVYGFITLETIAGSIPMRTPFENYYKIEPFIKPGYSQYVRGYFWMNYLSYLHIARLGGFDDIAKHAPGYSQKNWTSGIQLQLSDDINDYSDDQLKELRTFLSPLFPPNIDQVTPLEFYGNPIHRLVE